MVINDWQAALTIIERGVPAREWPLVRRVLRDTTPLDRGVVRQVYERHLARRYRRLVRQRPRLRLLVVCGVLIMIAGLSVLWLSPLWLLGGAAIWTVGFLLTVLQWSALRRLRQLEELHRWIRNNSATST